MTTNIELWMTTYPTVGTLMSASLNTLISWDEHLPDPTNDVERTVRRKIAKRIETMLFEEVKEKEPKLADKWNELMDSVEGLGIGIKTRKM